MFSNETLSVKTAENGHLARVIVYRGSGEHVDVQIRPSAWIAEVRLWRGLRWPSLERKWLAATKPWIPWFSLETQVHRAVRQVTGGRLTLLMAQEIRAALERVRRSRASGV
jgi:hypothetical protein